MLIKPHIPYDLCVGIPILRLLTCLAKYLLVGAFNQEEVLVETFSVIVKYFQTFVEALVLTDAETDLELQCNDCNV